MPSIKLTDIIWLAGLLEGEGCFRSCKRSGAPNISLWMTDKDVIERAALLTNNKVLNRKLQYSNFTKQPRNKKILYGIVISCGKAAGWMMTVFSQMGERRQSRIKEVIAAWKARRSLFYPVLACIRGHSYKIEANYWINKKGKKVCRICEKLRLPAKLAKRKMKRIAAQAEKLNATNTVKQESDNAKAGD